MSTQHTRKIFLNLPVRDLKRSVDFFTGLGFTFNPQFTDERATCMIVSDEAFVMLLVTSRFEEFAKKPVGDPQVQTSGIFAVSAADRAAVDHFADTALRSGGTKAGDPQDHGFMYLRSFFDPDGHHWEVMWMDPSAVQ